MSRCVAYPESSRALKRLCRFLPSEACICRPILASIVILPGVIKIGINWIIRFSVAGLTGFTVLSPISVLPLPMSAIPCTVMMSPVKRSMQRPRQTERCLFSPAEKLDLFQALSDCIPSHREKIRIFTPRCSLHALLQQYRGHDELTTPCRGGIDYFFVDSRTGHSYPCGYRGGDDLGCFDGGSHRPSAPTAICRRCDWECFRDPTELFHRCLISAWLLAPGTASVAGPCILPFMARGSTLLPSL